MSGVNRGERQLYSEGNVEVRTMLWLFARLAPVLFMQVSVCACTFFYLHVFLRARFFVHLFVYSFAVFVYISFCFIIIICHGVRAGSLSVIVDYGQNIYNILCLPQSDTL